MASGDNEEYKVEMLGDRRKNLRMSLLVLRVNGHRDNIFFGYAKDISRSGMFIATVNPRKIGEEFTVSFELPEGGARIVCKCRVAWAREFDPKLEAKPGMGIEFVEMDEETRGKIEEWVMRP